MKVKSDSASAEGDTVFTSSTLEIVRPFKRVCYYSTVYYGVARKPIKMIFDQNDRIYRTRYSSTLYHILVSCR